jgi:hypothetical protein
MCGASPLQQVVCLKAVPSDKLESGALESAGTGGKDTLDKRMEIGGRGFAEGGKCGTRL